MIATNTINKGLYLSIDPHLQPEGTVIKNHNGQFLGYDDGNFMWQGADGNKIITVLVYQTQTYFANLQINVMGMTILNGDLIIIGTNSVGHDYIGKIVFSNGSLESGTYHHIVNNQDLELSLSHPLRQFFAVYETENVQRVYWNDGIVSPRSLNIVNVPNPLYVDLLNFTPSSSMSKISMYQIGETTGSLTCGSYAYVCRLTTNDGAITDYSLPTNPINVNKKRASGNLSYYSQLENQGGNYDVTSGVGIVLSITNIDTRFDNIQVIAFKSIAKDSFEPGILIYDDEISGSSMIIYHRGSENLGGISAEEVNISSRFIIQAQMMELIKNTNTLAHYSERTELPEGAKILYNKILGVNLDKVTYPIPLDSKVDILLYNKNSHTLNQKTIVGVDHTSTNYAYKDVWYKRTNGTYYQGNGITAPASTDIPYLRIKKYTKNNGEIEYENISLQSDYLNYRSKKVSSVLRGYMGTETYRIGIVMFKNGKPFGVRYIGDKQFPVRSSFWGLTTIRQWGTYTDNHVMGNVMSLIVNNLDFTELVTVDGNGNAIDCLIDGFAIVRCKRDEQVISEGVLIPMLEAEDSDHRRNILPAPSTVYSSGGDGVTYKDRMKYAYAYYSPETLFRAENKEIIAGDKMKVHCYLNAWFSDNSYYGKQAVQDSGPGEGDNYVQKYYTDQSTPIGVLPLDGVENEIRGVYDLLFNADGSDDLVEPILGRTIRNESETPGTDDGYGCDTKIVILTNEEISDAYSFASWQHNMISIVDHYKPKSNLYGGTSDAALAQNIYYSTGHYQEITPTILNSIKANGKFEFNGIQVFGGDTYITLFDLQRIIMYDRDNDTFSQGMIFPIQTTINTEMREGNHLARNRPYHATTNPTGIGKHGSYFKLEDFNYNDGYSSSLLLKQYLPLPFGYKDVSESRFNIIWSNEKNPGEKIDNYRLFPVNNVKPVEQSFGFITSIINGKNKLIYTQQRGVGYVPIDERVTINSNENQPVQLGIGGKFNRYDTTEKFYGCQHYFSVCKVPGGVVWFDFNRRSFIFITEDMQLTDESIIKGLEPFFNDLDANLKNYDNPFNSYGIYTYYDNKRKEVVMVFKQPNGTNISITFNQKNKLFTGTIDIIPSITNTLLDFPIMTKYGNYNLWISNNALQRSFFGILYDSYIRFVVNNDPDNNKTFDNWSVIGNDNFFNYITYKGKNFEQTENILDNNGNVLSDYIKYLNFEWRGSFPLDNGSVNILDKGERLRGHYAEIEFKIDKDNTTNPKLLKLKTSNRKTE